MEEVKHIKPGNYILHKNEPFRIIVNQIVVTGTHSHVKNKLEMQGLFSKGYETIVVPPHDRLETIDIIRKKAQIISKANNVLQIMDPVSYETMNAETEKEVFESTEVGEEVTYVTFNNKTVVLEKRA